MQAGHPVHTLPKEYVEDGVVLGELFVEKETLKMLREGNIKGLEYDVLVATYPRSGWSFPIFALDTLEMY